LSALDKENFSSTTFSQLVSFRHAETADTTVVTHCIFRHSSGHLIHLVVFYQRTDELYLWHSSLPDVQHLRLTMASIQFGKHEGAFDR